jgi:hypothetical protein
MFHAQRQAGPDPIQPPTAEHSHSEARSLTGGRVYRGTRLPDLVGAYVYGDWSTGRVWGIKHDGGKALWHRELVDTPFNITGFGTDHSGELYVIDQLSGYYRFEPTTEADRPKQPFPTKLSETGLFASVPEHRPHPAALPFDVCAPAWADGASAERFAALPGYEKVEQKPQPNAGGAWTLPNGSVLVQTLSLDRFNADGKPAKERVETRLMVRQQGEWVGYSRAAGFVLGFNPAQLDRDHDYGGVTDDQLRTLEHIGVFQGALSKRPDDRPRLVDPYDEKAPLEARVRSYLHVNCSACHVKEGGGNARMELGVATSLRRTHLIDEVPIHTRFEVADARLVAPGAPERSVLYQRISRRGANQMPPLVSAEVDRRAVEMIASWIRGLPAAAR